MVKFQREPSKPHCQANTWRNMAISIVKIIEKVSCQVDMVKKDVADVDFSRANYDIKS